MTTNNKNKAKENEDFKFIENIETKDAYKLLTTDYGTKEQDALSTIDQILCTLNAETNPLLEIRKLVDHYYQRDHNRYRQKTLVEAIKKISGDTNK